MKNIKTIVVATMVAIVAGGCFWSRPSISYPMPEAPEGYIGIDAYEAGRAEDYVKLCNAGTYQSLAIQIMYHNPETLAWEYFGSANLKGPGDRDTMKHSTHLGGGLDRLRYFAVKFMDGKPHSVNTSVSHNDLFIYVGD
ncbi:MAG: hypothetical protein J6W80_04120 [Kiritimatiellae bacterium]|nr:hypothetical protein [Kiritimatiellia bacterium]